MMLQPKPEFLNPDDFPEPHMEPVKVSEAERLAGIWDDYLPAYHYGHVAKDTAAELRRLAAEVEALRQALLKCKTAALPTEVRDVVNAALRGAAGNAEIAALRADAERYRHVRNNPAMLLHLSNRDFDAAIDAAKANGAA